MKLFKILPVLAGSFFTCVRSQDAGAELLQMAMEALPKCAFNCTVEAISTSTCQLSDTFCILKNKQLNENLEACVLKSCTVKEALVAKNFSTTIAGDPVRDRTKDVSYTGMIGGVLAVIAVILRIIARLPCLGGQWGLDDWAILVAMLPILPLTGLSVVLANDGLGKDMWKVPFEKITHILYIYYFDESFYLSSIALTKISILLFYLRIFPDRNFRRIVFIAIGFCVCYIITFIPLTCLQCRPVKIAWTRWDGQDYGAHCINLNAEGWSAAALNIIMDLTTITLPIPLLAKLAMSRRKKMGIMLMFLLGGFVTIVSALRLKWMIQFANTQNVTWDYVPIGYWSTVEVHVGIICACMPALRALQFRLFPATKNPSGYYQRSGGSPFPSAIKNAKGSQFNTQASSTSMIRSKNREKDVRDKDFIQLEEMDIGMHTDAAHGRQESGESLPIFMGNNKANCERQSVPDEVGVLGQDRPSPHAFGSIVVKKEYSINVEEKGGSRDSGAPRIGPKHFYRS